MAEDEDMVREEAPPPPYWDSHSLPLKSLESSLLLIRSQSTVPSVPCLHHLAFSRTFRQTGPLTICSCQVWCLLLSILFWDWSMLWQILVSCSFYNRAAFHRVTAQFLSPFALCWDVWLLLIQGYRERHHELCCAHLVKVCCDIPQLLAWAWVADAMLSLCFT